MSAFPLVYNSRGSEEVKCPQLCFQKGHFHWIGPGPIQSKSHNVCLLSVPSWKPRFPGTGDFWSKSVSLILGNWKNISFWEGFNHFLCQDLFLFLLVFANQPTVHRRGVCRETHDTWHGKKKKKKKKKGKFVLDFLVFVLLSSQIERFSVSRMRDCLTLCMLPSTPVSSFVSLYFFEHCSIHFPQLVWSTQVATTIL